MPIELTDGHQVIDTIYVHPSDIRKWSAMDTIPPQSSPAGKKTIFYPHRLLTIRICRRQEPELYLFRLLFYSKENELKNIYDMNKQELFENIKRKESFLCVGLDTDIQKSPRTC